MLSLCSGERGNWNPLSWSSEGGPAISPACFSVSSFFYFCLFISGPPLFVALFFSFRFCDSPPLRSLIFSGFIARECQASLQLKRLQSHYCRNRSCGRRRRRRRLISRNGAVCVMGMAICNLVTEVLKSCNPWINCNWTPVFQRFLQTNPWTLICFAIVPPINPKLW